MKKFIFVFAALTLLFTACQKDDDTNLPKGQMIFEVDEQATLQPDDMTLTLTRIVEDGRCPSTMQCIWAGRVVVEFRLEAGRTDVFFQLTDNEALDDGITQSIEMAGKTFELLEVTPYPETGNEIPQKKYRVKINVN